MTQTPLSAPPAYSERSPQTLAADGGPFSRLLYYRDLLIELVRRDLIVMYKRSVLGIAWTLLTPLLQLLVFSLLFYGILSLRVEQYASYAFTGLLVWTWFQSSLQEASKSIVAHDNLLLQPDFPPAVIPLAVVTVWLIHMILATPALLILFYLNGVSLAPSVVFLPAVILLQFALIMSFAYPLAALNVTFRDVSHILTIVLNLVFPLTPIFYSKNIVPSHFQWFYELNPLTPLIEAYRSILMKGQPPDWSSLAGPAILIAALLPAGYLFFKKQSIRFVEEL